MSFDDQDNHEYPAPDSGHKNSTAKYSLSISDNVKFDKSQKGSDNTITWDWFVAGGGLLSHNGVKMDSFSYQHTEDYRRYDSTHKEWHTSKTNRTGYLIDGDTYGVSITLIGKEPSSSARLRGAQKRQTNTTTETITRFVER